MGSGYEYDGEDLAEAARQRAAAAAPEAGLDRRELLRSAGAATIFLTAVATGDPAQGAPAAAPARASTGASSKKAAFFSAAELALVDELGEIILPTDEHSAGARAAGVAVEIDRRLAERPAYDNDAVKERRRWRVGLRLVDRLARRRFSAAFLAITAEQRLAVVTEMAASEAEPRKPEELFFGELKAEVARAYYTSEIGLKQELEYKGNSYLQEFAGQEAATVPLRRKPGPSVL